MPLGFPWMKRAPFWRDSSKRWSRDKRPSLWPK
jgi:hypothetical protein